MLLQTIFVPQVDLDATVEGALVVLVCSLVRGAGETVCWRSVAAAIDLRTVQHLLV